ncbi:MAG: Holliday junction branch migration DNA helicase RuvB [Bacilli bacterium]
MNEIYNKNKLEDDLTIRPSRINEYIGQEEVLDSLKIFIKAALLREEPLDHILIYGPPGLGKTTLAMIIANEMKGNIKLTSGPAIEKSGDLVASLSSLNEGDVLFIDEIHRIPKHIEELLYSAMEDFSLDIIIGNDNKSRTIRLELPPFTLIGATTRIGDLTGPLRDRFGIVSKLNYYTCEELTKIIERTSKVLKCSIDSESSKILALRSRGTPRIANRLYKRVRDYAMVETDSKITIDVTKKALVKLHIDKFGLDNIDINMLLTIQKSFDGGPVGLKALASSIGEEVSTIEDVYEPFLLQNGFLKRTSRGRVLTEKAIEYLKRL